ncbi:50S ribosomal protein L11 [Candidatus Vidania fulgoroideorum]
MKIRLLLKAQTASPKPPIGSILGQKGVNVLEFCKNFNILTKNIEIGTVVTTIISIKKDKSFSIFIKKPTLSFLFKKYLNLKKGSSDGNIVSIISKDILYKIYSIKKSDMNCVNKNKILKTILGTAKSLGIKYEY